MSTQAVRNYEQWGFLLVAERGPQGYRRYGSTHLSALQTARALIDGFGWERARQIMECIHHGDLSTAFAVIDAYHAIIHQSRLEVEETLRAIQAIADALPPAMEKGGKRKQFHIGEVAGRTGVRVSAIRFWEEQGLIQPARDRGNSYRLYNEQQVRLLQVAALLRKAGYDIEATRTVLIQLAQGTPEQAMTAAENRLRELMEASRRCVKATTAMWAYIEGQARLEK
jgi:DNA-binding transcriptional MerR regulator